MSIHSSLKSRKNKARSVLKRHERLAKLIRTEKWIEGNSVYGLQKINPPKLKLAKKIEKETPTTLGKIDMLEEHRLIKEKKEQSKKSKKNKKEITGR